MPKWLRNQSIGALSAKTRYYWTAHKARWEQRYKKSYPENTGIFGRTFGIRWVIGD